MTETEKTPPTGVPALDDPLTDALVRSRRFFTKGVVSDDLRTLTQVGAVTGIVGAAGGLGGFVPPLVMGSIFGHTGDYGTGLLALAAMAVLVLLLSASLRRPVSPQAPRAPMAA